MLTMYNYDFDRVAQECLKAPENMRAVCFKSYGRDAAGHTLRKAHKIVELCAKVPPVYTAECVIGAVNVIVDFWGEGLGAQASKLCALFQYPYNQTCYTTLASRLHDLYQSAEEKQKVCNTFEPDYRNLCSTP